MIFIQFLIKFSRQKMYEHNNYIDLLHVNMCIFKSNCKIWQCQKRQFQIVKYEIILENILFYMRDT